MSELHSTPKASAKRPRSEVGTPNTRDAGHTPPSRPRSSKKRTPKSTQGTVLKQKGKIIIPPLPTLPASTSHAAAAAAATASSEVDSEADGSYSEDGRESSPTPATHKKRRVDAGPAVLTVASTSPAAADDVPSSSAAPAAVSGIAGGKDSDLAAPEPVVAGDKDDAVVPLPSHASPAAEPSGSAPAPAAPTPARDVSAPAVATREGAALAVEDEKDNVAPTRSPPRVVVVTSPRTPSATATPAPPRLSSHAPRSPVSLRAQSLSPAPSASRRPSRTPSPSLASARASSRSPSPAPRLPYPPSQPRPQDREPAIIGTTKIDKALSLHAFQAALPAVAHSITVSNVFRPSTPPTVIIAIIEPDGQQLVFTACSSRHLECLRLLDVFTTARVLNFTDRLLPSDWSALTHESSVKASIVRLILTGTTSTTAYQLTRRLANFTNIHRVSFARTLPPSVPAATATPSIDSTMIHGFVSRAVLADGMPDGTLEDGLELTDPENKHLFEEYINLV